VPSLPAYALLAVARLGVTFAVIRLRSIAISAAVGLALVMTACGASTPTASRTGQTSTAATPTASSPPAAQNEAHASGLGTPAVSVAATTDFKYDPSDVSVKIGDVIQWTNLSAEPDSIIFEPGPTGGLSSPTLQKGDTWQIKFSVPGTYPYISGFHAGMIGHVTVSS
jgi:plastocyanin